MADDTRVTLSRSCYACAFALLCVLGCALPARALAASDPRSEQWSLEAPDDGDIDVSRAWQSSEGLNITVAVVDQRIEVDHPDLAQNIQPGGRDFVQAGGCTAPTPVEDHGTQMAGIIAARRDNGIGYAGVAPEAKVLPLPAIDNCGAGSIDTVTAAFDYAGRHEIPIVSASFSTDPWMAASKKAEYNARFDALFKEYPETLFVVAAGNEGNDNDQLPVYPCSTLDPITREPPPNLVCVGMSRKDDAAACAGNVGVNSVDLFAPGTEIWSTFGPDGYRNRTGTSQATAIVAGVAALVKSYDPSYGAAQVKDVMVSTVDEFDWMGRVSRSGGRVNAARAVAGNAPLGSGGSGGPSYWSSCDNDHDGIANSEPDLCPDQPGLAAFGGCPDTDADRLPDYADNCPGAVNSDQTDTDGDGLGDACDATPRGADADLDGTPAVDDRCPTQAGTSADGCPLVVATPTPAPPKPKPTPTPAPPPSAARILDLRVAVTPRKCVRGKPCKKAAKVTVKLSRTATVSLKLEQRVRQRGRLVWKRVTTKSLKATASGRTLTVRAPGGRGFKAGSYRLTATLSGSSSARRNFRV